MNQRDPGLKSVALMGAVAIVAAWGCAAGVWAELEGAVVVAGKAVSEGSIVLVPLAGTKGPSAGGIIAAGRYRLTGREGVRPGRFQVQLSAVRKTGRMIENAASPGTQIEEAANIIPPSYGQKSTLEVEIHSGANTLDITIP